MKFRWFDTILVPVIFLCLLMSVLIGSHQAIERNRTLLNFQNRIEFLESQTIRNVEDIKKANVLIVNKTLKAKGSGTHIKIKGQSYILTVAHMVDNRDNELIVVLDDKEEYSLFLAKVDNDNDLALYKINLEIDLPYIEIADEFPKEGTKIILVGNPDDLLDMLTDGIIAKIEKDNYYVTNKGFYGSSGGAFLYRGKLIGVFSKIGTLYRKKYGRPPRLVNFGWSVSFEIIKEFLKGVE